MVNVAAVRNRTLRFQSILVGRKSIDRQGLLNSRKSIQTNQIKFNLIDAVVLWALSGTGVARASRQLLDCWFRSHFGNLDDNRGLAKL